MERIQFGFLGIDIKINNIVFYCCLSREQLMNQLVFTNYLAQYYIVASLAH